MWSGGRSGAHAAATRAGLICFCQAVQLIGSAAAHLALQLHLGELVLHCGRCKLHRTLPASRKQGRRHQSRQAAGAAWPGLACRRHRSCPRCIEACRVRSAPGQGWRRRSGNPSSWAPASAAQAACPLLQHMRNPCALTDCNAGARCARSDQSDVELPRTPLCTPTQDLHDCDEVPSARVQGSPAERASMARFPPRSNGRPLPFAWPAAHCSRSCSIQVVELKHC